MATIFSLRSLSVSLPVGAASRLAVGGFGALLAWGRRLRERGQLAVLDDRALADIGLTRADIMHEIDKRFWQV
jgi:uncharacterized protein YjiS (DUF1127 family)